MVSKTWKVLYENRLKPVLLVSSINGRFPYVWTSAGYEFSPFLAFYSYILYLMKCSVSIISFQTIIKERLSTKYFYNERIFWGLTGAYNFAEFIHPLVCLIESSKLVNFINGWAYFEEENVFKDIPERLPNLERRAKVYAIIIMPASIGFNLIEGFIMNSGSDIPQWFYLQYSTILASFFVMGAIWYMTLDQLRRMGDNLLLTLPLVEERRELVRMRLAWLHLSGQLRELGSASGLSIAILLVLQFSTTVICFYSLLVNYTIESKFTYVGLVMMSLPTFIFQFSMCDTAHRALRTIGVGFKRTLLKIQLFNKSEDFRIELDIFLKALKIQPPVINIVGHIEASRNLFTKIIGHGVSYLIVLLQFRPHIEYNYDGVEMECNFTREY